jgi:hypothetical protein
LKIFRISYRGPYRPSILILMGRDKSITEDFIADLNAGFQKEAERVRAAPTWPETQKRIVTGTQPYLSALARAEEGWTREDIERELAIQTGFGEMPNAFLVIGNRRIDEEDAGSE